MLLLVRISAVKRALSTAVAVLALGAIIAVGIRYSAARLSVARTVATKPAIIYLATADGRYLVPVTVKVPETNAEREAVLRVLSWPSGGAVRSPFDAGIRLTRFAVRDETAEVNLSGWASSLPTLSVDMASAALVYTLTEFPTIRRVSVRVDGSGGRLMSRPPLINHDGSPPGDHTMKVTLWFGYAGQYLVPVTRFVPRNVNPPVAAVEALIQGPLDRGQLSATLPQGTRLLGLRVSDALCTVDLSSEMMRRLPEGTAAIRMAVDSVVRTLTEFPDIRRVEILVEGKRGSRIGGNLPFDGVFERGPVNPVE